MEFTYKPVEHQIGWVDIEDLRPGLLYHYDRIRPVHENSFERESGAGPLRCISKTSYQVYYRGKWHVYHHPRYCYKQIHVTKTEVWV